MTSTDASMVTRMLVRVFIVLMPQPVTLGKRTRGDWQRYSTMELSFSLELSPCRTHDGPESIS